MTITAHSLKCRISELQDEFDSYAEDAEQQLSILRKELNKLDSLKETIKELLIDAKEQYNESKRFHNSFGHGYDSGRYETLGKVLDLIDEN